jgi:carbon monoxide dehydrogenase subunit G
MTVRVERTSRVDAPVERVWEFLADPANRAEAISVVERVEQDGDDLIWHVALPLPLTDRTVAVRTRERERDPPTFVRFTGSGPALDVTGEHELEAVDGGTAVHNRFVVDGRLPGVERYFERTLGDELTRVAAAIRQACAEERVDSPA